MEIKISLLVMIIIINLIQKKLLNHLKKLRNKLIGIKEFKEEYDRFIDNIVKFEYFKSTKKEGSVSPNQKKNEKICKRFKRYC